MLLPTVVRLVLSAAEHGRTAIRLSNHDFRAYRKRNGAVALRLFSHLLLDTRDNGHIDYFFIPATAHLTLSNAKAAELNVCYPDAPEFVVGDLHVYHIWIGGIIPRNEFAPGVATLCIHYTKKYDPFDLGREYRHTAIVKHLPINSR